MIPAALDSVKLHRRRVHLDGVTYVALCVRPGGPTFEIHHGDGGATVASDGFGLQLLGQVCWAISHQQRAKSIAVIDIAPTDGGPAADAAPAGSIVIASDELGLPTADALGELVAKLPWATESEGTIKLVTRGFEPAITAADRPRGADKARTITSAGTAIMLSAPQEALAVWAVEIAKYGGKLAKAARDVVGVTLV